MADDFIQPMRTNVAHGQRYVLHDTFISLTIRPVGRRQLGFAVRTAARKGPSGSGITRPCYNCTVVRTLMAIFPTKSVSSRRSGMYIIYPDDESTTPGLAYAFYLPSYF